jgi:hypothetical protein
VRETAEQAERRDGRVEIATAIVEMSCVIAARL